MNKAMRSVLFFLSVILFPAFMLGYQASAQKAATGMEAAIDNFTTFREKRPSSNMDLWRRLNGREYYNHPEFGILPEGAPNSNCIEVYSERRADRRFFRDADDTTKYYSQQALGELNVLKNGNWETIDHRLQPAGYKIYKSVNYKEPVVFNLNNKELAIQTTLGKIAFNNWQLIAKDGMQQQVLDNANLQDYTIGEDGMYVRNIFKGIDATFKVYRGAVKTNFIIKSMRYGKHDMLLFRDAFSGTGHTKLEFIGDASKKYGTGQVAVFSNGNDVLHINEGVAYVKGLGKEATIGLQYEIDDNTLQVLVPGQWIEDHTGHEIVIDPLVTSTATLAQNAITGSGYNATCFNGFCAYNLNVNIPAASAVTDVRWTFNYIAAGSCWLSDGALTFQVGTCRSPSNTASYWFCNTSGTGTCTGNNLSIMNHVSGCLPAPACTAQTLPVQMRFYRCFNAVSGCSGTCIGAGSPWTLTLEGHTVEFANPDNNMTLSAPTVCEGGAVTAIAGQVLYGASPYTYSWSLNASGTPVAATGTPANITLNTPGNNNIYLTIRDACNNAITAQRNVTVLPTKTATQNITICSSQLPYTWNGITVNVGGNNAATFTSPAAGTGCDSITTLNLTVNPTKAADQNITICSSQLPYTWNGITVNTGGNNAANFTSPAAGTGCDSITTLNLTVNPTKTADQNITICSSQLPYTWNGITVNMGGNNVAMFTSPTASTGCDSTTTLNLTVNPTKTADQNIIICSSQLPYTWNGITVNNGGNNAANFTSPAAGTGCDSITTLNLTVNPTKAADQNITICANQLPYVWNGITVNMGGNNAATFTSPAAGTGCDSTTTLNLTVNPTKAADQNITICSSQLPYAWNGITVNAGGNNVATFTSPATGTGCDSITTLNLTVNPTKAADQNITICSNQLPYTWNGITVNTGGNNAATFTSPVVGTGCDSVTTLNLTVNPTKTADQDITICANQLPYVWNGITINMGGNNAATFTSPAAGTGCDSTTTLNLTVNPTKTANQNITICSNQLPYMWNGVTVNTGGNNAANFTSPAAGTGCDSVTTLNLTVNPTKVADANITICSNQLPYTWNAITVNAGGNNAATFTSPAASTGCDSTTTLNLTVNPTKAADQNITICSNQLPYTWNGITVNAGGNNAAMFTSPAAGTGCDSVTTLNLTVNPLLTANENITICASQLPFTWNGIMVNMGGNNVAMFTSPAAATGCDSATTLNLIVNPVVSASQSITICSNQLPYTWNGITVNAGGNNVATYSTSTVAGCDSIVHLNLMVNPTKTAAQNITVCANQLPYTWNGITVNAGGNNAATFTSPVVGTGCDSITTLNLMVNPTKTADHDITICSNQLPYTWNGITVNSGGNNAATYTSPVVGTGCDSTTTLNLTVNPTKTTNENITICSNQLPYTWNGITVNAGGNNAATFTSPAAATGCDSTVTLQLTVMPPPVTTIFDTTGCGSIRYRGNTYTQSITLSDTFLNTSGCDSFILVSNLTIYPNAPARTFIDTAGCEKVVFEGNTYTSNTLLADTFRNIMGCDSMIRIVDITIDGFELNLTVDPEDPYQGEEINLIASSDDNNFSILTWSPAALFPLQDKKSYTIAANTDNVITIIGVNENGCADTATVAYRVRPLDYGVFIPNAFSPNVDGRNDLFGPRFFMKRAYAIKTMKIFNRWGQLVYSAPFNTRNAAWDGNVMNGTPADVGNYMYYMIVKFVDGTEREFKGDLTLLK